MGSPERQVLLGIGAHDAQIFADSVTGDVLMASARSNQRLLFGTLINAPADLSISRDGVSVSNKLGVGTSEPAVSLDIVGTDALALPVGCNLERPADARLGMIRYNTELEAFEGLGAGCNWTSLGGVIDVDRDTFIRASNDNSLQFFASNAQKMDINYDRVEVSGFFSITESGLIDSNLPVETTVVSFWSKSNDLLFHDGPASATRFSGSGSNLTNLNAGALSYGIVPSAVLALNDTVSSFSNNEPASANAVRLAYSNADARAFLGGSPTQDFAASNLVVSGQIALAGGVPFLSDSVFSFCNDRAATADAVRRAYSNADARAFLTGSPTQDFAASNLEISGQITLTGGVPFLSDSVFSFCNDRAATADAVRRAYSNADARAYSAGSPTQAFATSNLTVDGTISPTQDAAHDLGQSNLRFRHLFLSGQSLQLGQANLSCPQSNLVIDASVGIGTAETGAYKLRVQGDGYFSGDCTVLSDAKHKADLRVIDAATERLSKLTGYTFSRRDVQGCRRFTGLLAQDVLQVLPEAVHADPSDDSLSVAYGNLAGLLVEGMKDIFRRIDAIEQRLKLQN